MVASYTERGRVSKQGNNDNPNTWGVVLNEQVFDLFDIQIDGVLAIDVTGTSDVTLTTSNGSDDQARYKVLEFTGTLGADIDVIIPSVEKVYLLRGAQTGGTVTVKINASATSVVIANGAKKLIYSNGLDVYDMTDLSAYALTSALGDLAFLDTVDTAQIEDDAITTDKIADGAVTQDKLAPDIKFALIGELKDIAHNTLPTGWLFCYGQAVSRSTYSELFAAIGTEWGAGDGSTTFNIPDLRGRGRIGKDDMGGSAASRVTTAGSGLDGTDLGAAGGSQNSTLTAAQSGGIDTVSATTNAGNVFGPITVARDGTTSAFIGVGDPNGDGGGAAGLKFKMSAATTAHPILQPVAVVNTIIFANV